MSSRPRATSRRPGADGASSRANGPARQRAWVLHPILPGGHRADRDDQARLAEAVGLALALGVLVVGQDLVMVRRPRPSTLLGQGRVTALAEDIADKEIDLVIVDASLAPVQQRELEKAWRCKVIDRTGLILEIFGARARTREGRLQVELAALSYQRSRLVRSWTHLERQRGGFGFLGGPGESQLEVDRRLITARIGAIKLELARVVRTRGLHRRARRKVPYPVVALVGYTNAGKSTLFNRLTGATVAAEDKLFATLDPTMRAVPLPSGRTVILSDTVGFISDLPTDLVAAFRATLEEVIDADLILHVRDVAHSDSAAQRADVVAILSDLGIDDFAGDRVLDVLNKIDLLTPDERASVIASSEVTPESVAVSALDGQGIDRLLVAIDRRLAAGLTVHRIEVSLSDGAALSWLYRHGTVLDRFDQDLCARLQVGLDAADLARFRSRFKNASIHAAEING